MTERDPHSPRWRGVVGRAIAGVVIGVIIFIGFGLAQLTSVGLSMGVLIGLDGQVQSVTIPTSAYLVGLAVIVLTAVVCLSASAWWDGISGRLACGIVLILLLIVGTVMYDADYFRQFGYQSWARGVFVSSAQCVGTYAAVGLMLGTLLIGKRPLPMSNHA